jgi:sugar phosphate isomerase/epimerase
MSKEVEQVSKPVERVWKEADQVKSRRTFLTTVVAGLGTSALRSSWAEGADRPDIKTALGAPVGLQLWSLREALPKDLPGTLAKVRAMGFREVEGAGLWGKTVPELRAALDAAGLRCTSAHMGMDRLGGDLAGALAEAKALGALRVVCPWIDHAKGFARADALKAAEAFNRIGKGAKDAGLHFGYHCHGYEFVPSTEGTLFDTLAGATDAATVEFQIDVFHAYLGGADPARLIEKYKGRVTTLHVKDLKRGFPVKAGTDDAPGGDIVPVGMGQVDYPAVLRAAIKAGVATYYVEDESADPFGHIPKSVAYLEAFKP